MIYQTLKEVYKNSSEKVKGILEKKFTKLELGIITKVNQEEFNQLFRDVLECCKKNVSFNWDNDYSKYTILDGNGDWLFDVSYDQKHRHFRYSYHRIFPYFQKLNMGTYYYILFEQEINELMIPVVEQDFKLVGVIPDCLYC